MSEPLTRAELVAALRRVSKNTPIGVDRMLGLADALDPQADAMQARIDAAERDAANRERAANSAVSAMLADVPTEVSGDQRTSALADALARYNRGIAPRRHMTMDEIDVDKRIEWAFGVLARSVAGRFGNGQILIGDVANVLVALGEEPSSAGTSAVLPLTGLPTRRTGEGAGNMSTIKVRPSPTFCPEMLAAVLAGRKTMTRRLLNPQPPRAATLAIRHDDEWTFVDAGAFGIPLATGLDERWKCRSPYGGPGTIWYLREPLTGRDGYVAYANDDQFVPESTSHQEGLMTGPHWGWQRPTLPAMYMPAWAARHWLRVKAVRVERLQTISEADATAEGCAWRPSATRCTEATNVAVFRELWDRLNAARGHPWADNPFVWVYSFERTEKPE